MQDAIQPNGLSRPTWLCQCDCGKQTIVRGADLNNGFTKSCGCLRTSFGEERITNLLLQAGLSFEKEKTFPDCRLPSGRLARFDFYVNNSYLIEFDGKQHFLPEAGWGEDIRIVQERDKFKNEYCKNKKIPLIRISYENENDLKINDVILETTRYLFI